MLIKQANEVDEVVSFVADDVALAIPFDRVPAISVVK